MQRFRNQPLSECPHIAVLGSDKVGNFVNTTPLLRGLREKYPTGIVDFFGSDVTFDFEMACPYIDARFSLFGTQEDLLHHLHCFVQARRASAGPYELVINCNAFSEACVVLASLLSPQYVVGQALRADLRSPVEDVADSEDLRSRLGQDPQWNRPCLADDYPGLLRSGFIAEIFCCLAFIETDFHRTEIASVPPPLPVVPDILLHTIASRTAKEWSLSSWREVVGWCQQEGLSIGLVGSAQPGNQADPYDTLIPDGVIDLRGALTLPELAGAFERTRAAVVVDAGPMHVAAAVGCETICLFGNDREGDGASPFYLWSPQGTHIHVVHTPIKCTRCAEERFRNRHCLLPGHPCLTSLEPRVVIETLANILTQCDTSCSRHELPVASAYSV